MYSNYTSAFNHLNEVSDLMKDKADEVTDIEISNMITGNFLDSIDELLQTLQDDYAICGNITARTIAIMITNRIHEKFKTNIPNFETVASEANTYLTNLKAYYNSRNSSTDKNSLNEDYNSIRTGTYQYEQPFATLKSMIPTV